MSREISKYDLLQDLKAKYGSTATRVVEAPVEVDTEKAFVVETEAGRTILTAPVREIAAVNQGFTYLRGRFVGADRPNDNGALWTTSDLEMAEATVAGGPLNWLHDDHDIIGCLMSGDLVREAAAQGNVGTHITSTAVAWKFLFPEQTAVIEKSAADGQLYYSMECLSRAVACVDTPGRPGCGMEVTYGQYDAKGPDLCAHLRERSSVRRFIEPWFLGGAVIIPPVRPGWSDASVDIVRQAAALNEREGLDAGHLTKQQALDLATSVLAWGNRAA